MAWVGGVAELAGGFRAKAEERRNDIGRLGKVRSALNYLLVLAPNVKDRNTCVPRSAAAAM